MALQIRYNQRSHRIPVTPGTIMSQVLTSACTKCQIPIEKISQYELLHRSRPIDLSLPFRLSGISNNAILQLKVSSTLNNTTTTSSVRVCIQLLDGKRVQGIFTADTTLDCILSKLELSSLPSLYRLDFLNREITMESLSITTLRSLGIVSGSAIFRVQQVAFNNTEVTEDMDIESKELVSEEVNNEVPSSRLPRQSSPEDEKSNVKKETEAKDGVAGANEANSTNMDIDIMDTNTDENLISKYENVQVDSNMNEEKTEVQDELDMKKNKLSTTEALELLRSSNFDAVSREAVKMLLKIVTNVLSYPTNEKMRSIRLSNAAFVRVLGQCSGGIEFLEAVGFQRDGNQRLFLPENALEDVLRQGLHQLHREADDLQIEKATRPQLIERNTANVENFNVFQSQVTRMAMQPRGPSATEMIVDQLKQKEEELMKKERPDRQTKVYLRHSNPTSSSISSDITDDSNSDSSLLLSSMKKRISEGEKAKNFQTLAMRELEAFQKKKVFQKTVIRVQFPDRSVLEGHFHPMETIQDVVDHIRSALEERSHCYNIPFYLYVSPPKQKLLKMEQTLMEAQLVPAALVYLNWILHDQTPNIDNMSTSFKQEFIQDMENAQEHRESYPKPVALMEGGQQAASSENQTAKTASASTVSSKKKGKKPSWLKL